MRIRDWSADVCSSDLQALDYPDRRVVDRPDGLAATWALDRALQSQSPIADAEFPPADRAIGLCPDAVQIIGHGARSEERRAGKECVSPGSIRWSPYLQKQKQIQQNYIRQ